MPGIAPSILSADFAHLAEQIGLVEGVADTLHIDAMDAHFVPPLSIGPVVVRSIRQVTRMRLNCHLMVEHPETLFPDFAAAGADVVTWHIEAESDPRVAIRRATELGMRPGLAVNLETPVEALFPYLDDLDRVLIMSIRPGWAGQAFVEAALPKIRSVRDEIDRRGLSTEVEVDGGINEETGARSIAAGATVLTAATSIFGSDDPARSARRLARVAGG